jgi:hypothetical protein
MTLPALVDESCALSAYVRNGMAVAREDVEQAARLLASAANVEWVSDLAALYHQRLADLSHLVRAVGRRVDGAESAVNQWMSLR